MKYFFVSFLILYCSFGENKKCASEIYNSGRVGNFTDFKRTDNGEDSLMDTYVYIYDTNFLIRKRYGLTRAVLCLNEFYYFGKKVGKWICYDRSGRLFREMNFKNDEYDGFNDSYQDDGKLATRELINKGKLLYFITYDREGHISDSVSYIK